MNDRLDLGPIINEAALQKVVIRTLLPIDSDDLRALRLEALERDGRYFASSYARESNFTSSEWIEQCLEDTLHCMMGLFHDTDLIGMSAISPWIEDVSGRTALFGSSYITKKFRTRGLASLMYAERLNWASRHPHLTTAVVYHRRGNEISKNLNEQHGAEFWQTRTQEWGDGTIDDAIWYRIKLQKQGRVSLRSAIASEGDA